jgi:hypothetical protein
MNDRSRYTHRGLMFAQAEFVKNAVSEPSQRSPRAPHAFSRRRQDHGVQCYQRCFPGSTSRHERRRAAGERWAAGNSLEPCPLERRIQAVVATAGGSGSDSLPAALMESFKSEARVWARREDAPMCQATLRTGRLRLVPLSDEHLEYEVDLDADPEVMRYLGDGRVRGRRTAPPASTRGRKACGRARLLGRIR